MVTKRLFSEKFETWTADAVALEREINAALEPILKKAFDSGFDGHDIEHVAAMQVVTTCSKLRIYRGIAIRKKERDGEKA